MDKLADKKGNDVVITDGHVALQPMDVYMLTHPDILIRLQRIEHLILTNCLQFDDTKYVNAVKDRLDDAYPLTNNLEENQNE